MTWRKTHFEKVACATKFDSKIVLLDPVRLNTFKKVEVSMATQFFSEETNKPLIWYYKNKDEEIEYFTAPGLHPVNGETLRKITEDIIQKYVPIHIERADSFVQ